MKPRESIVRQLLSRVGLRDAWVAYRDRSSDLAVLRREGRLEWGAHSYGSPRILTFEHDDTHLSVGSFVSIASGCTFVLGGNHRLDRASSYPLRIRFALPGAGRDGYPWSKGDISVGSDVWIGANCTIVSGVSIGTGAVIGAGSLVLKDVAPYEVVGGSPARVIGSRCTAPQVDAMLRIAWWEWPLPVVLDRVADLSDLSIAEFIAKYADLGSRETYAQRGHP